MSFDVPFKRATQDDDDDSKVEGAVLVLEKFGASPWVRFGHVVHSTPAVGTIVFVNNTDAEEMVLVDKIGPSLQIDQKSYRIPPRSNSVTATVTWTPDQIGGFRDSINFKVGSRLRLKVIAFGVGVEKRRVISKVDISLPSVKILTFLSLSPCLSLEWFRPP